jgi:hypothetical protein
MTHNPADVPEVSSNESAFIAGVGGGLSSLFPAPGAEFTRQV